jgi:hypothetical protein
VIVLKKKKLFHLPLLDFYWETWLGTLLDSWLAASMEPYICKMVRNAHYDDDQSKVVIVAIYLGWIFTGRLGWGFCCILGWLLRWSLVKVAKQVSG